MSGDLVRWLSGCLDAIEDAARAVVNKPDAIDTRWWPMHREVLEAGDGRALTTAKSSWMADHIALHDPRAVLARVKAERRLIAAYTTPDLDPAVMADVLRIVAYGHRFDHPGYDPAWAPDD